MNPTIPPRRRGCCTSAQEIIIDTNLAAMYRVTSLIRKRLPLGPYSCLRSYGLGGGRFLMSEVPLYVPSPRLYLSRT